MRRAAIALAALCAVPAAAQDAVTLGTGAVLRGLDKVGGQVTDVELAPGGEASIGRLTVRLRECRYPEGDPARDAFAFLEIRETNGAESVFNGWMIASSPALNALDHPRYDVWVMRCKTE